ncbi:MAG: hypothetical protein SH817_10715 [Leptospira sp.]|nr:hypothetical protein [Leptospira sp.]
MEFALFLFFIVLTSTLTGVISYYANLLFFQKKEMYQREEITHIWEPALRLLLNVCESGGNLYIGLGLFFGFALFAWAWSLLGGILGTPHYTSSPGNYFFQTPLLFIGFLFGYNFLKEGFSSPGPAKIFFDSGRAVLSGLGIGYFSSNLTVWGLYHEFFFLFVLISGLLVIYPLIYYWNGKAFFGITIGPKERYVPQFEDEDIYMEDEEPQRPSPGASTEFFREEPKPSPKKSPAPTVSDWDEIDEGGLGDEPPTLDDFDDLK